MQNAPTDRAAPICYALEIGAWSPLPEADETVVTHPLPDHLMLDPVPAGADSVLLASDHTLGRWGSDILGRWLPLPGDSIRVDPCRRRVGEEPRDPSFRCPPPMGGFRLRASAHGDSLSGRMLWSTDSIVPGRPSEFSAPVTGRRVPCP